MVSLQDTNAFQIELLILDRPQCLRFQDGIVIDVLTIHVTAIHATSVLHVFTNSQMLHLIFPQQNIPTDLVLQWSNFSPRQSFKHDETTRTFFPLYITSISQSTYLFPHVNERSWNLIVLYQAMNDCMKIFQCLRY